MKKILCLLLVFTLVMPVAISVSANEKLSIVNVTDTNSNGVIEEAEILAVAKDFETSVVAFFNAEKLLINCSEADGVKIPENTKTVNVLGWKTASETPKEEPANDDTTEPDVFGGDDGRITVGFFGASTTSGSQYTKFIEHYYQTRYPDKDIVFVNKGIPGNSLQGFINRFGWDITEDEISGKIDEAIITFGFNDCRPIYYVEGENYSKEKQDENISKYAENLQKVIDLCKGANIKLTVMSPQFYDANVENCTSEYPDSVNTYGLYTMTQIAKETAAKNDLPFIDFWTPLTETTNRIRNEYGVKGEIIASGDGIHPGEQGGFYMAYVILRAQEGKDSFVAKVNVDASAKTISAENATVTLTSASDTKVEYEYLAKAIPIAYQGSYKQFEEWGVNITEEMNLETIKVTGLAEGTYKVTIGGSELTLKYTADELAKGINISTDLKNPAQMQSLQAYMSSLSKSSHETAYRSIATTEQALRNHPEIDPATLNENTPPEVFQSLGAYSSSYQKYFSTSQYDYGSKMYEVENWKKIRDREQKVREMSKPVQRTVIIEKQ